jgi:ATP-binding cassette subfamily F protein 3
MEERRQQLEEEVSRVEAEIAECENALAVFICAEETARLSARLERGRAELQTLVSEWEELSLALESQA